MEKLTDYLKAQGAKRATIVSGPNGDFISATKEGFISNEETPDLVFTIPVGKKSQSGRIIEMNVLIAKDSGQAIATMNNYDVVDEVEL